MQDGVIKASTDQKWLTDHGWSPLTHFWESALILQAVESTNVEVRGLVHSKWFSWKTYFHYNNGFNIAGRNSVLGIFRECNLAEARFEIIYRFIKIMMVHCSIHFVYMHAWMVVCSLVYETISPILNTFVEITFLFCFLMFCSLSNNKISADGVCALLRALLVNQSLQKLKLE